MDIISISENWSSVLGVLTQQVFLHLKRLGGYNMQNKVVRAFRQRLVRGGFIDISIYSNYRGIYYVRCVDPKGKSIQVQLTEEHMDNIPRLVWFDDFISC